MRSVHIRNLLIGAALAGPLLVAMRWGQAQQSQGGFIPGKVKEQFDPAVVAHGKTLFDGNCQACHGRDLRGGDIGGPNLLRSQVALRDVDGDLIVPVIQGSRQASGMPNIGLNTEDAKAVAAYVRSVIAQIGRQGTPPGEAKALNVVIGNASQGQAYFQAKCSSCHSAQGDLAGIASKITDPKTLQNTWVSGRERGAPRDSQKSVPTATVTLPSGEKVKGQLLGVDDFLVVVRLDDGTLRTIRRDGRTPEVIIDNPLKAHEDMLPLYTDNDIHNVTAYLVTLK
jgi:cytochrome c oxidase cbb3-type subunit 3